MKTQALGSSDLQVTRIAYGCMRIGGGWDPGPLTSQTQKSALKSLRAALDQGINFFDHADIYCRGRSEEAFSALWKETPALRQKIYLQSKCGCCEAGEPDPSFPGRYDLSYTHILQAVEGSLRRLKTSYLDVLLLHRPDALVEPDEVAKAFDELHQAGKVRWFGVSNHTAAQIELLQHSLRQPIVANQVEFNLIEPYLLDEGILFNQDNPRLARNESTLEYCRLHHITLQAWGPLAWGLLTGRKSENPGPEVAKTIPLVAEMAHRKGVSGEAILIAWILRHPAKMQAVIGTTQPERIAAACQGDTVELTREEWYQLFISGRNERLP